MRRIILGLGTLTAFALFPLAATAAFITGSFDGIARIFSTIPQTDGPPIQTVSDAPVSGSFAFETDPSTLAEPPIREPEFGPGSAAYFGLPTLMEFTIDGFTSTFNNDIASFGGPQLFLGENEQRQVLSINVSGPYWYAQIDFVDLAGALFEDLNPLTFDPGAVDVANSFARYSSDIRSIANEVTFTRITFDGHAPQPVPNPGMLALFLIGAAGAFTIRRRAATIPRAFRSPT